jgi:ABC-type multidrug transport system ATPase subunit
MDGVLHLASPDPPIPSNTPLPVEAACASGQADDRVLLRVDSINKPYADQVVLTDVAFDIQHGQIIGIIGPNGAGKTTLLEALAGILPAETNDVYWRGRSIPPWRRREAIFYLPDGVRPYQDQPVTRVLSLLAIHQLMDAERICDRFILLADGLVRGVGTLNDLRARTAIPVGNLEDIFLALT